jgi:hypothetical protein
LSWGRQFITTPTTSRPVGEKRNTIDYTFSNVATETEAKEILVQASRFYGEVEDWITKNHPELKM